MHPNPAFRKSSASRNVAFARELAFGVLCTLGDKAPLISHVPFLLSEDGKLAEFHLVRSNPIARALRDRALPAALAVQGPHSYVSPDWYGVADQVPTWNYIAVHLSGQLSLCDLDRLPDLLVRQSAFFEDRLRPKAPWAMDKMTDEAASAMMRQIVPCQMIVDHVDGTWKLSQNKPDDVRLRAADNLENDGTGQGVKTIANLMRDPDE